MPETGPLNPHFVRDIGCACILTGFALAGLAFNERAWPAAPIGALFLTLHALVHVADGFSGRVHANHVLTRAFAVRACGAAVRTLHQAGGSNGGDDVHQPTGYSCTCPQRAPRRRNRGAAARARASCAFKRKEMKGTKLTKEDFTIK